MISLLSLSNLEQKETEHDGTEDELVEISVAQGVISGKDAFERVKLIGDDKAKELNNCFVY
ncbi:predicted protein [Arabidopsis lyrata subsp. lyrata]|uniref:Predicted protein n=1 Tax=Arabidopsis lyrata subsp. lyrata TaxID=81972 RepID=D7MYB1_ARALL|nr:predicted protein [Arabidopsis lyrata subsp. lyrata]